MILAGQDSGPSGRWGHGLIVDPHYNRLLVVGGRDATGPVEDSLWSFDFNAYSWMQLDIAGPPARSGSAIAAAPGGTGFFSFGGEAGSETLADLWWFNFGASSWQQIGASSGTAPGPRSGAPGVFDNAGRFIVSHGRNGDRLFDDTWAFDPATGVWSDISPVPGERPMARFDHEILSLPNYGLMLLTGGCSDGIGPCPQGDLWAFDPANGIWSDITPEFGPTARTGAVLGQLGGTLLMVGGMTDLGPESDVWRGNFDGGTVGWYELTLVNHGPMGIYRRSQHALAGAGSEFYVFGGRGVEGPLSDLWQFSFDRYTESEHSLQPGDSVETSDTSDAEYVDDSADEQ